MKRVLIVSHADADGHIIAEQVRRNLSLVPGFQVTTLVDPVRTKDHKTWTKLNLLHEIEEFELIFFVDLMFAPSSFGAEADALVAFASERPNKRFFVMDHHPIPLRHIYRAPNLHPAYRRDVIDCTIGNSSWMMCIAALLEKQPTRALGLTNSLHKEIAMGIRCAAAPGGLLAGDKLLALLRFGCWPELALLGRDAPAHHRLPRGRRPRGWIASEQMLLLDELAGQLLASNQGPKSPSQTQTRNSMSYDLEIAPNHLPPKASLDPNCSLSSHGTDLEAIVTLLELAALSLTHKPGDTFDFDRLLSEARDIGGEEIEINETDVEIVLDKATFLKKEKKRQYCLK